MLMYGGNGVQLLPRFQDKFQALLNEHQNTIEDQIEENTEIPGKIIVKQFFSVSKGDLFLLFDRRKS